MSFIRTVLGDVDAEDIGITYSHEHIIIDESFATLENPDFLLNDVEKVSKELKEVFHLGGRTMIDAMPANCGRNVSKLVEVSLKTGMNIVAPTGIHLEVYYPDDHWRYHYSEDQLTRLFVDDITLGIDRNDYANPLEVDRTEHKAGLIKLATGDDKITAHQEKIFHAVVNAHKITGAPILTHTNYGALAMEQVEQFSKLGADLSHVVLSHVDRYKDVGYNRELLQTGVNVEYDSAFRWSMGKENWTYKLLEALLPEFPNQITVGMDAARHTYWKSYGGNPGLIFLLTTFVDELEKIGLSQYFNDLFVNNPKRLFAFSLGTSWF
ncbi:aryldialkylphosphatase [Reichenbachiella sp. MALMAid0571]|uniref:phosphotriesterase family protein n=1 Tax=Reichenbachiella sp. MALMAid0571 TaxID=3143939 RepID=UPI0032DE7813